MPVPLCPIAHRAVRSPWRHRSLMALLGALLLAAPPGQASAAVNEARLVAIYEVYGFLLGQQLRLQEIIDGQSGLRHEAVRARATFEAAYPRLQERVERQLIRALGRDSFYDLDARTRRSMAMEFAAAPYTPSEAAFFLATLHYRAQGDMNSRFLSLMLAVLYADSPAQELRRGHGRVYVVPSPDALGTTLHIRLPFSWHDVGDEDETALMTWRSWRGGGSEVIRLLIRERPPGYDGPEDTATFLRSATVREGSDDTWSYREAGTFTGAARQGFWVDATLPRPGSRGLRVRSRFHSDLEDQLLVIECQADDDGKTGQRALRRIRPLCSAVLDGIVVLPGQRPQL